MAHSLIIGMTESGKTTLAKQLAKVLASRGESIIVLDPLNSPDWSAGFQTADADKFLEVFWANRSCHAFIDEAGDVVGQYDDLMRRTATKGRHWGHSCYYIAQRGQLLNTTVRAQCRHLFLFAMPLDDCKALAKDFNKPELLQANSLAQGEYFHVTRFGAVERGKLF